MEFYIPKPDLSDYWEDIKELILFVLPLIALGFIFIFLFN